MYWVKNLFEKLGGHWSSFIIWNKDRFVLSMQDYHRKFEPILYGWNTKKHYWCGSRKECDVWDIPRPNTSPEHPTMKPIALCERAIKNSSKPGDLVLDLFVGSGSTLIACENTNRRCYAMDIEPKYCSVTLERWEKLTGKKAVKEEKHTAGNKK